MTVRDFCCAMVALGQAECWRIAGVQLWTSEIQALLKLSLLLLREASFPTLYFFLNLPSWSSWLFQGT